MKPILDKVTILAPTLVLALLLYSPEPSVAQPVPDDEVDVTYVGASATVPSVNTTQGDAVMVMGITLADEGIDQANVFIDGMTFRKSAADDFADWTAVIEGVELVDSDGRSDYSTVNILADRIEFSGFDQGENRSGRIENGLSKTYELRIWLKDTVDGNLNETLDERNFVLEMTPNVDIATAAGSSGIRTTTTLANASTDNEVVVTATQLLVTVQPPESVHAVFAFDNPRPRAQGADANGNWALRYTSGNFAITNTANFTQQNTPNHISIENGSIDVGAMFYYGSGDTRIEFTDVENVLSAQTDQFTVHPTVGLARNQSGLNAGTLQSSTTDQAIVGLALYTVGALSFTDLAIDIDATPVDRIENIRLVKAATSTYQASDAANVVASDPDFTAGQLVFSGILDQDFSGDLLQNFYFLVADVEEYVNPNTADLILSVDVTGITFSNNALGVDSTDLSTDFNTGDFTYNFDGVIWPAPSISSVTPDVGPAAGGTSVTISGSDFQAGASADFDGVACTGIVVTVPDTITCTTPAGMPGLVDVTVTNPDSQSATLNGGYEFIAAPSITGISPDSGMISGGFTVTIDGDAFQPGAQVLFNGTACADLVVNPPGSITCTAPPGPAGAVDVTVQNPDGQTDTLAGGFIFIIAGGPAPIAVPAMSVYGITVMVLLIAIAGLTRRRRRLA